MNLLDLIFPKRCLNCKKAGEYLCDSCFSFLSFEVKTSCLICGKFSNSGLSHKKCKGKYSIEGSISAISYNKIAKKLIHNFKEKPYLSDLESFLAELFTESIIQNEDFNKLIVKGEWLLVPIPLSSKELRKRGYNQSEILAKALTKKLGIKTLDILNKKDEFEIRSNIQKNLLEKVNIFLVDDVVTTGKTLKEAALILKKLGVNQVFGLTLARG